MTPVRVPSSHPHTLSGKFPSIKMGRMISYESLIEKDFIYILEYEKSVSRYEEQPISIKFQKDHKYHSYIPDFYAFINGENWIFECKPEKFVNSEENEHKFSAAKYWCNENNSVFEIITGEQLRYGYYLKNIKVLTSYARFSVSQEIRLQLLSFLKHNKTSIKISDVIIELSRFDQNQILIAIFQMSFFHEIFIPINQEFISLESMIQLDNEKELDYEQLQFHSRNSFFLEGSGVSSQTVYL